MDSSKPHFRAVTCNGTRRGLRLERGFWSALEELSRREGIAVGQYVDRVFNDDKTEIGLSGRVRAAILRDLAVRASDYEERLSIDRALSIVQASPSPAFILSEDKRILGYNKGFLDLVHRHFSSTARTDILKRVGLTLDASLTDIIAELIAEGRKTVAVGFAFGVADQRVRGQLAIALAPVSTVRAVMAYVVN